MATVHGTDKATAPSASGEEVGDILVPPSARLGSPAPPPLVTAGPRPRSSRLAA
ncbi:hypothetical protein SLNWT_6055 [Streptomyces albus]|uniref:Uncharacterized protein n=1 Tax=Streptomyces albus (strain ATCC 21838 / DSM 41398 / FERM P-419 / JCM 4703 / NBRC 107858) TaxID=1081613 RepID=A0A0B5F6C4_STRA4|nr:hypothetical protein SLNWT_6055 [Streptomyces albus]AOU80733.1 hypothetical protein SLNHY_6042 [Streptomyces albus]AYN36440.1 hypothetical protein DUI70_5946 [Streptomyces albus]